MVCSSAGKSPTAALTRFDDHDLQKDPCCFLHRSGRNSIRTRDGGSSSGFGRMRASGSLFANPAAMCSQNRCAEERAATVGCRPVMRLSVPLLSTSGPLCVQERCENRAGPSQSWQARGASGASDSSPPAWSESELLVLEGGGRRQGPRSQEWGPDWNDLR